jgi:hypothetical protein
MAVWPLVGAAGVFGHLRLDDWRIRRRKRRQGHQGHHRRAAEHIQRVEIQQGAYVDLLAMLFEVLAKVRKEGLMSIENDVENPHESPIFSKYPSISHDHHVMEFITDYLRMMVGGNLNAWKSRT